jgi:hypothetical protein
MEQTTDRHIPTRTSTVIYFAKACLLQFLRAIQNRRQLILRHPQHRDEQFANHLAESATSLWTDSNPSELWYQRGKIQNLRIAASRLHLCVIPAGAVFSFWRQVGRASAHKGYVRGRMLQEGCMIPAIGGGLCQLSNALYQVALDAGCEIVERHPHSRVVPGSATAARRDATVAWNYIDLRFRAHRALQLQVKLTATHLNVSMYSRDSAQSRSSTPSMTARLQIPALPIMNDHACESCGQVACFRSEHTRARAGTAPVTAFLLDAAWPEFSRYVEEHHGSGDIVAMPMNGKHWNRPQYAWPTDGFAEVNTASLATLVRSLKSRRIAAQGASRQRALLARAQELSRHLARGLTPDVDEVCVSQSLLPFLWSSGALGGRRVRVLGYQLPARVLQAELDRAARAHPESETLKDFRADDWMLDAEDEALFQAEQIITPHSYLAALFPSKTVLLKWSRPAITIPSSRAVPNKSPVVFFPSSTLGRKGAYELREALRGTDIKLLLGGRVLEDENFWNGFQIRAVSKPPWEEIDMVVQPSIVESEPRMLLRALCAGIPVLTTANSGLHAESGAQFVPALDVDALRTAITERLSSIAGHGSA